MKEKKEAVLMKPKKLKETNQTTEKYFELVDCGVKLGIKEKWGNAV